MCAHTASSSAFCAALKCAPPCTEHGPQDGVADAAMVALERRALVCDAWRRWVTARGAANCERARADMYVVVVGVVGASGAVRRRCASQSDAPYPQSVEKRTAPPLAAPLCDAHRADAAMRRTHGASHVVVDVGVYIGDDDARARTRWGCEEHTALRRAGRVSRRRERERSRSVCGEGY